MKFSVPPNDCGVFLRYNLLGVMMQPILNKIEAFSFTASSGASQASSSLQPSFRARNPSYPSMLLLSSTSMSFGQPDHALYQFEFYLDWTILKSSLLFTFSILTCFERSSILHVTTLTSFLYKTPQTPSQPIPLQCLTFSFNLASSSLLCFSRTFAGY